MTNEIEKAARDLVQLIEYDLQVSSDEVDGKGMRLDALISNISYKKLKQALDPKPTKEQCIAYFQAEPLFTCNDGTGNLGAGDNNVINATIEYLQEPQKGVWIENTGVNPNLSDCKLIIQYGGCDNCADLKEVQSCDLEEVDWVESYPEDRIYRYMIIE